MGSGVPWAGLYPNLQVITVQGLLLAGAVLAWVIMRETSQKPDSSAAALSSSMDLAAKKS
jgi:hypothetical protein